MMNNASICLIKDCLYSMKIASCSIRHWAKKKLVKSTHYLINDSDSALYRHEIPGKLLANCKRLPNRKTRSYEYRLGSTRNGTMTLLPPYPPNVNITLDPYPRNSAGIQKDSNKMGHVKFMQKYKGIEYRILKRMVPYPRRSQAYTLDIDRIS